MVYSGSLLCSSSLVCAVYHEGLHVLFMYIYTLWLANDVIKLLLRQVMSSKEDHGVSEGTANIWTRIQSWF